MPRNMDHSFIVTLPQLLALTTRSVLHVDTCPDSLGMQSTPPPALMPINDKSAGPTHEVNAHVPQSHNISWPRVIIHQHCPALDCPFASLNAGTLAMCKHFQCKHPLDTICTARDGHGPKCTFCGLQRAFPNGLDRLQSEECCPGRKLHQKRVQANRLRRQMGQVVTTGGVPLGAVQTHQCLGKLLACNNNDWPAMQTQLKKARSHWGSLSRIPVREGATPRVSGMFHKAVVQPVLLHGCES